MIPLQELTAKIKVYDPDVDEALLSKAYDFGLKAHGAQKRASGEPYFSHPIEVAEILTTYRMDVSTIVTALLHDTVEDTHATLEEIEKLFGPEIAKMVDGVTKLSRLESRSENSKQAENFRKLVVAMSEDLRVLLVKLADRLHNMRTLSHIVKPEKRKRIAKETLEIYAALAERIGMRRLKDELQDIAFRELFPEARESIVNRLNFLREKGRATIEKSRQLIVQKLEQGGLRKFEVFGREKQPYSIWKKMEVKNVGFEQLADIIAYRIIVEEMGDCYLALGIIHSAYHTIPGYFKDYISTPKGNGYQSLHTAVIGPQNQRIEVQIRTRQMHEVAEYGLAAHWSYKQSHAVSHEGKQFRWIRELLEILEQSDGPDELLENTKLEMYHDQVFCFTPKGDILPLPRGATPVDFAYAVHSGVGNTTVGAKINGRIVPLKTRLKNGDQVEIITSKTQTPSPAWERFVITAKARAEIRKFVRSRQREEYISLGRAMIGKLYRQASGKELTDKMLEPFVAKLERKSIEDIYADLGEGTLSRQQVMDLLMPENAAANKDGKKQLNILERIRNRPKEKNNAMPIRGLIPGMAIHFAGCCHPIPGDKIVGIVTTGRGVTIHTTDCDTLDNYTETPERWIDVAWDSGGENGHRVGRLRASVSHEMGSMAALANSIARDEGNISNFKILSRNSDFFEILIDVEVRDVDHLNRIIADMRSLDVVQSVERYHD